MDHEKYSDDGAQAHLKQDNSDSPIAVIGLAFEFPQDAVSEETFWQMLCEGRNASTDFPKDRVNIDAFYHPDDSRPSTLPFRGGHFLKEDLGAFDAPFFSITPGEAACMDPQHRRLMETAYHAMENAGLSMSKVCGTDTAVYTGCFTNDYLSIMTRDHEMEQAHAALGTSQSMLANRVSWFYDLKGASVNLDSACSSGLLALHLACQELKSGSASMALVGGSSLTYHPDCVQMLSNAKFMSRDSRCWSFDERGNGYARGEGIGVVIVKRLSDAIRDGNTIRTVIRSTGSNQDGRTPGITQPSQEAQLKLIRNAYQRVSLDMTPTRYFEAHGTGTALGDPTEAGAIGRAFIQCRSSGDPLYVGSVKANIGHLEGASGLAGIIKTILILEKGLIPPVAGLQNLNHRINADELYLKFPREVIQWPATGIRRACINSFGYGGTNAVAILDDAYHYLQHHNLTGHHHTIVPSTIPQGDIDRAYEQRDDKVHIYSPDKAASPRLLVFSASDKESTIQLADNLRQLPMQTSEDLADAAFTLATKRTNFAWRNFKVADCVGVGCPNHVEPMQPVKSASNPGSIAFVFTGQGAQYEAMGHGLSHFLAFKNSLIDLDQCLREAGCQQSLRAFIETGQSGSMNQPEYSQALTTCLQIALVDLFRSFGITPSIVLGHSSGEIAAAYAAGALSRSSAVRVAYWRGILSSRIASEVSGLGMMAVGTSRHSVLPYLERLKQEFEIQEVTIGCVNSPKSVTLTGKSSQLSILEQWLQHDSIFARKLQIPVAYHSSFMQTVADDYQAAMGDLEMEIATPSIPMVSSVTGSIAAPEDLRQSKYWVRNLTSTVEFEAAVARAMEYTKSQQDDESSLIPQVSHILEIGPHKALQGPIRENLQGLHGKDKPKYIPTLTRDTNASVAVLTMAGTLFCDGQQVDLLVANNLDGESRSIPKNMPAYPFNHKQSYWKESRFSKNFRLRQTPRHDLLGTQSLDWNPHVAQWRNVIRIRELPWLEDHKVDGQCVFPAAGMVTMAVEALKQLQSAASTIRSVEIKNTSFMRPMRFSRDTNTLEIQLTMSTDSSSFNQTNWSRFRLFAYESDKYVECCTGDIRAVLTQAGQSSMIGRVTFLGCQSLAEWTDGISQSCEGPVHDVYSMLGDYALEYGPCFQNVEAMRLGETREATATVKTQSWKSRSAEGPSNEYIIHPTTLDGLTQLVAPSFSNQGQDHPSAMVPSRVGRLYIDFDNAPTSDEDHLNAFVKCALRGRRGGLANIVATTSSSGKPFVCFERLETSFIDSIEASRETQDLQTRHLCTQLDWKPDVDLLSNKQIYDLCTQSRAQGQTQGGESFEAELTAIACFIDEAVAFIESNAVQNKDSHLQVYVEWMRLQRHKIMTGEHGIDYATVQSILHNDELRQDLIRKVKESGFEGAFLMRVGQNLINVLQRRTDPLDLLFRDNLIDRYYEEMLVNDYHIHPLLQYFDLLSFKNPSMNILEVGAGTGGQTLRLLESMASGGAKKWARYDYTDISASFFDRVHDKFQRFSDDMDFRTCDITQDPAKQSFEENSYDVVIAAHVLHATNDIGQSLSNIRKLLKPGGKLVLVETTNPESLRIGFVFGLLKGWWSFQGHEQRSELSPCLNTIQWDQHLQQNGFSGIDLEFLGQRDSQSQYSSIIVSSVPTRNTETLSETNGVAIVCGAATGAQAEIAGLLKSRLKKSSIYTLEEFQKARLPSSTLIIFLLEVEDVFLDGISEDDWLLLRSILLEYGNTIWVTKSKSAESEPRHHLVSGFGHSLSSEDARRKFVTLALDKLEGGPGCICDRIIEVSQRVLESPVENLENNYIATSDTLEICRISKFSDMNTKMAQVNSNRHPEEFSIGSGDKLSLHHRFTDAGHTLHFYKGEETTAIGADDVIVETRAMGLSQRDLLLLTGQIDDLEQLTECAGIVTAAGENTTFKAGDRVCFLRLGSGGTYVQTTADSLVTLPEKVDFNEAVAFAAATWLSYHALMDLGRLEEDEFVLVPEAAGAFGQMAVQLATSVGAKIMATASSPSQRRLLCEQFNLSESAVLDSRDPLILQKVNQLTSGQGVDVVVAGTGFKSEVGLSKCLAPSGRMIDIGPSITGKPKEKLSRTQYANTMYAKVDIAEMFRLKPARAHKIFKKSMSMAFNSKLCSPELEQIFDADQVTAAVKYLSETEGLGKVVVQFQPGTRVMASVKTKPTYTFPANATYIIAGGLGGLGRTIARWMASRGARNLVLLSRSGAKSDAAKTLVEDLRSQGVCCLTPSTDISNIDSLRHTVSEVTRTMPPIRGCIQATVALRDTLYENMSQEDWSVSINSKVTGSWNLHLAMPHDLDTFILLSSIGGIYGSRAQANYAAGNTFKDALARYRVSQGLKAVSLDLGFMVDEGMVAESEFLLASMRRLGILMEISTDDFTAILDHYCDPSLPLLSEEKSQILTGLELPSVVTARGVDLHHAMRRPIASHLYRMEPDYVEESSSGEAGDEGNGKATTLSEKMSDVEAIEVAKELVLWKLGQLLGMQESEIDADKSIQAYGIDSLVALDLKNWLHRELGVTFTMFELMDNLTLTELSVTAIQRWRDQSTSK